MSKKYSKAREMVFRAKMHKHNKAVLENNGFKKDGNGFYTIYELKYRLINGQLRPED